ADPVKIDGKTQPGFFFAPLIRLDNGTGKATAVGLDVSAGSSTVRGLSITGFGTGVRLRGAGGNTLTSDWFGLDLNGAADGNGTAILATGTSTANVLGDTGGRDVVSGNGTGIDLRTAGNTVRGDYVGTNTSGSSIVGNVTGVSVGASGNTIGGTGAGAGNVVSGSSTGVLRSGAGAKQNVVLGNRIGTDVGGTLAVANETGVELLDGASANTIGGATTAARNLISGNIQAGVKLEGSGTTGNLVRANYIGTDAAGTGRLANGNGIVIDLHANGNTVGGTGAGARNVISGNESDGVHIGGVTGTVVSGNFIGTDGAGDGAVATHRAGVELDGTASGNTIGGTTPGARNVISGNNLIGVLLDPAQGNTIEGNYIGTTQSGSQALGNGTGVDLANSSGNTIGGTGAGARNVISGNVTGVQLREGAASNVVEGNYIGTDAAGTADVGNAQTGVLLSGASNNRIGGTAAGSRNVIYGNDDNGIELVGSGTTANVAAGNLIGTDVTASAPLPNGFGVLVENGPTGNTIGGTAASAGNTIADNPSGGVAVDGSTTVGITIERNSIFDNSDTRPGIWLTSGANDGQPAPTIAAVATDATNTKAALNLASFAASTS